MYKQQSTTIQTYIWSFFFLHSVRSFFRLGLSMGCSELEFLGQIASFERRLRGAAPTPLALPYPFGTSTWTRMDAERDKREARKKLYFERHSPVILRILMYMCMERLVTWNWAKRHFQIGVIFCTKTNNIDYTVKKSPWYRDRYDIILIVVSHFIVEFR